MNTTPRNTIVTLYFSVLSFSDSDYLLTVVMFSHLFLCFILKSFPFHIDEHKLKKDTSLSLVTGSRTDNKSGKAFLDDVVCI